MSVFGPGKSAAVSTPAGTFIGELPCQLRIKRWFADVNTVKKMYTAITRQLTIRNEEEILSGYFESDLDFGNIQEDSERVKVRKRALAPDEVTVTDGSWYTLSHDDIIKSTVVVTDTAETAELIEGVDFRVDYTSGRILRIPGSEPEETAKGASAGPGEAVATFPAAITVKNVLKVQYEYFSSMVKDVDYSINYEHGSLCRKEGGSLVSGEKVYVDYRIRELVQDDMIMLSIDQAHTWILQKIGTSFETSLDDNLRYAEAYFALYLISKMSAANLIYEKRNDDIEEAAKELKLISNDYRTMALSYLQDYFCLPAVKAGARVGKSV